MDKEELPEVEVSDSDNESIESNENKDIDDENNSVSEEDHEEEEDEDNSISEGGYNSDDNSVNDNTFSGKIENYDDDDDDDDLDEDYLKKISKENHNNILQNFHPELVVHNIDEIKASCVIVKDKKGNIIDPLHKTLPFITSYEKTRIIGERAKQLNEGAHPLVEIDKNIIDGYLIALKEYEEKKIPFIIQRPLPNGTSEYWRFCDLECLE